MPSMLKQASTMAVLTVLLMNTFFSGYGQTSNYIPPSPNAASLGQYGDVPVSNYTGVPGISIPLYTVKSGEMEMPISLSYHASGIRVAQEASWVGLGWSLNAGGVITRQVSGVDDLESFKGYVTAGPLPPRNGNNLPGYAGMSWFAGDDEDIYSQILQYHAGVKDAQPDFFFYNFFGYSGKLIFQKGSFNAIAVDQNNLIFSFNTTTSQWEVTDGNGWKYYFGTPEVSRSESLIDGVPASPPPPDVINGWYLDRAVTPSGDEITFTYRNTGRFIASQPYFDERGTFPTNYVVNGSPGFANGNLPNSYATALTRTTSTSMVDEVFLERIDFNNGYVTFNTAPRKDRIRAQFSTDSPALSDMSIYTLSDGLVKKVVFDSHYFNADKINHASKENHLRLRLNAVRESFKTPEGTFVNKPAYKFTYDETPLPVKNSSSVDHWGYYNGANNESIRAYRYMDRTNFPVLLVHQQLTTVEPTLIPFYTSDPLPGSKKKLINGANREPNRDKMQAAILKSIEYPTGGVTRFNYEPNDYYRIDQYVEEIVPVKVDSDGIIEKTFTLSHGTFVFLAFNLKNYMYSGDPNSNVMNNMTAVLEKTDGTDIVKFIPSDDQEDGVPGGSNNTDQMDAYVCVFLDAGTYRVKTHNGGYSYLDLSLEAKYVQKTSTLKKMAGGIRIESIDTYEWLDGQLSKRKRFKYEEGGQSTGRLMSPIQSFYDETDLLFARTGSIAPAGFPHNIVASAGSIVPLGSSAQGSAVGYNKVSVTEEDEDGETLGTSVYYYKNQSDNFTGMFFPGVPPLINLENGQLEKEEHLNKAGTTVKEIVSHYYLDESVRISGLKTLSVTGDHGNKPKEEMGIMIRFYDIDSEWWHPTQTIETTYDVNGANPVTTTTNYEYSSSTHKQLTKTTKNTSTGQTQVTTYKYPSDNPTVTQITPATFTRMTGDNILNPVIKQEVELDGSLTEGMVNNYTINEHDQVVVGNVQKLETGAGTYETRFTYQKHDDHGNVLEVITPDGMMISYIWSYNHEYPVVKAENIDHATLKSAVENAAGTTDFEAFWRNLSNVTYPNAAWYNFNTALRNNPGLQNAVVSTYTHTPLTGTSSETDANGRTTYYEYDVLKRLQYIRDHEGKILKSYEYHFANE